MTWLGDRHVEVRGVFDRFDQTERGADDGR
jgi:hypothetical protein